MEIEGIMTQLATFLGKQELEQLGLREEVAELRRTVKDKLETLRTAHLALASVEERDETRTEPSLEHRRQLCQRRIATVETYFDTDLMPRVRRLRQDLVETGNGGTLAAELDRIVSEVEMRVQPRDMSTTTSVGAIPTPWPLVISRAHLEEVQEHQKRLKSYVEGYIAARERQIQCTRTRSRIEQGKHKLLPTEVQREEYWEPIVEELASLGGIDCGSLPEANELGEAFEEAVGKATSEVKYALDAAKHEDLNRIKDAAAEAFDNMGSAVRAVDMIATQCREGAKAELEKVSRKIEVIFEADKRQPPELTDRSTVPAPFMRSAIQREGEPQRKAVGETLERQTAAGAPLPKLVERKSKPL